MNRHFKEFLHEHRPADEYEILPVYKNAFLVSGFGFVLFFENNNRKMTEFACISGRVYDLRFERKAR